MERMTFNEKRTFFDPKITSLNYGEIAEVYRQAFAGDPWYEVSRCADGQENKRCLGGYSPTPIGEICSTCLSTPSEPAYEIVELSKKFTELEKTRPTQWYLEKGNGKELTLAAVAWKETASVIFDEKYPDVPEMKDWLGTKIGENPICWLDEVFADKQKKQEGNLNNFQGMVMGLAFNLDCKTVAYRTINPRMTRAAIRDFGNRTTVFDRNIDVPDRRDFVIIKLS